MKALLAHRWTRRVAAIPLLVLVVLGLEGAWAMRDNGVPYTPPPKGIQLFSEREPSEEPQRYLVLGDSTVAGQGAPYARGIAVGTARFLARRRAVAMRNLAHPGSTVDDVRRYQLSEAIEFAPDVVLISAGANDATHLARPSGVADDLRAIIEGLRARRCEARIVITGVADLSSTPRLLWPLGELLDAHGRRIHREMVEVAKDHRVAIAPIAEETGPRFAADDDLFAADGFHPNAAGYALWTATINAALARAPSGSCARAPAA